ncbi:MAG: YdcF family protein [Chitinophagaceae bacterium]|nr:YdcF family protein [Chitinophagaceae bacterium]
MQNRSQIGKCLVLLVLVSILYTRIVFAQQAKPIASYQLVTGGDFVQSKNYYLLTLFQELPDVKKLLVNDTVLSSIAKLKSDSLAASFADCGKEGNCYLNRMKFTEDEIKTVGERLSILYQPQNALGKLVQNHLIPSGCYVLFQNFSAKDMLLKAWEQDAHGVNFCIDVYAGGNKPNYPNIDSISFSVRDPRNPAAYSNGYLNLLYNTASLVAKESKSNNLFFLTSVTCALHFLEMNERDQAADFEPMTKTENKLAFEKIKTTKWNDYKYSVILIPGAGPDDPKVALSAEGMLRCRLAAILYKKGLAPFIVSSGGKVHPYKTKFCEAEEQKKYLTEKLGIPASAIIIDPHARHTTTNMRNTVRMIFRYGMPFDKAAITCTTKGQSNMIAGMIPRCMKELNEAPYKNGNRLSETELEFYPLIEALHINPTEPIDP